MCCFVWVPSDGKASGVLLSFKSGFSAHEGSEVHAAS